jgi:hypothetical protein
MASIIIPGTLWFHIFTIFTLYHHTFARSWWKLVACKFELGDWWEHCFAGKQARQVCEGEGSGWKTREEYVVNSWGWWGVLYAWSAAAPSEKRKNRSRWQWARVPGSDTGTLPPLDSPALYTLLPLLRCVTVNDVGTCRIRHALVCGYSSSALENTSLFSWPV